VAEFGFNVALDETWDACGDTTLRREDLAGEPCWIGADLAQLDDLSALALVFKRDDALRCYLPELVVQERIRAVPAYRECANMGLLTLTSGNMIEYAAIEADIRGWCQQFEVKDIVFDQFGSVQITGNLANDGTMLSAPQLSFNPQRAGRRPLTPP
jgi:phage terminase large subunit-like protein